MAHSLWSASRDNRHIINGGNSVNKTIVIGNNPQDVELIKEFNKLAARKGSNLFTKENMHVLDEQSF